MCKPRTNDEKRPWACIRWFITVGVSVIAGIALSLYKKSNSTLADNAYSELASEDN